MANNGIEQLENLGKKIGELASTAAKKAGDQVQIAKLSIDKAGLEKETEGVYAAIGRYCYTKAKAGESLPVELGDYCADLDALLAQIADIDADIAAFKAGDAPIEGQVIDVEPIPDEAPADDLDDDLEEADQPTTQA